MEVIEVKGIRECVKALKGLDQKMLRKTLAKALRAGSKVVRSKALQLAPEGNIRSAIKVRSMKHTGKGARASRKDNVGVAVQIDVTGRPPWYYAVWVEFDHNIVKGGPLKKGGRIVGVVKGKFYMKTAYLLEKEAAIKASQMVILGDIKQENGKVK